MTCCICSHADAQAGVLCDECRDALLGTVSITGEQIQAPIGSPLASALVDVWGQVHRLRAETLIGRTQEPDVFVICEASVSRTHARVVRGPTGWTVRDLGSVNGTFIDDQTVREPRALHDRARIRFGFVSFYFLADASGLAVPAQALSGQTERPFHPVAMLDERTGPVALAARREVAIEMSEPSGGGGGVVRIDGRSVHLTLAQYELVTTLIARMVGDAGCAEDVRGYITSEQLASVLSLESFEPHDDSVRQLVRRVRRRLHDAGIGDIIESKYGMGYRLGVTPRG